MSALSDEDLQRLFAWVDTIPLSRAKKNINRDFSDGVLAAEVVAYYFPKLVDLHNYVPASSQKQKHANWATLNHKVLRKIKHHLAPPMIEDLVQAKPGAIEAFLHTLQYKLARHKAEKQFLQQQHHQQQQSYQQQHYQQQQTLGMGMDGTFAAGTCIIDGEEALVGTGGIDSSDPHVPAHQHAFHLHPYPHPPASPSTSSAFAASPGGHHHHHHHRATGASTAASASASGSPRRQHFVHPEGGESHLPSPFDRPATAAAGATPASLQMMGAATERRVGGAGAKEAVRREVDEEILLEKEETIQELRETVELLELKLSKLEQLLRLKDGKIERLSDELARLALGGGDGAQAGGAEEEGEEEGGAALGLGDEH